mmetsp:Transcript_10435/g.38795  ORF Transcript_10435/g.38795 Transcript_10435/m.38795 type:complete len:833 (-) Transcript_10435:26-2524(-)
MSNPPTSHSTSTPQIQKHSFSIRLSIPTLKIKSLVIPPNIQFLSALQQYVLELFSIPIRRQKFIFEKRVLSPEKLRHIDDEMGDEHQMDDLAFATLVTQSKKISSSVALGKRPVIQLTLIGSVPKGSSSSMVNLSITDCLLNVMQFFSVSELREVQAVSSEWRDIVRMGSNRNSDRYYLVWGDDENYTLDCESDQEMGEHSDQDDMEDIAERPQTVTTTRKSSIHCIDNLTGASHYTLRNVKYFPNQRDILQWNRRTDYRGIKYALIVRDSKDTEIDTQQALREKSITDGRLHPKSLPNTELEDCEVLQCINIGTGKVKWSKKLSALFPAPIKEKLNHIRSLSFMRRSDSATGEEQNTLFHRLLQEEEEEQRRMIGGMRGEIFEEERARNDIVSRREQDGEIFLIDQMMHLLRQMDENKIFLWDGSQIVTGRYLKEMDRFFLQFRTWIVSLDGRTGKILANHIPSPFQKNLIVTLNNPIHLFGGYIALTVKDNLMHILDPKTLQSQKLLPTDFSCIQSCIEHYSEENGRLFVMLDERDLPQVELISQSCSSLTSLHTTSFQLTENYLIDLSSRQILDLDSLKSEPPKARPMGIDLPYVYEKEGFVQGYINVASAVENQNRFGRHSFQSTKVFSTRVQKLHLVRSAKEKWTGQGFDSRRVIHEEYGLAQIWENEVPFKTKAAFSQVDNAHDRVFLLLEKDTANYPEVVVMKGEGMRPSKLGVGNASHPEGFTAQQLEEIRKSYDTDYEYYVMFCFHQDFGHQVWRTDLKFKKGWRVQSLDIVQGMLLVWLKDKERGNARIRTALRVLNPHGTVVYGNDRVRGVPVCWNIVRQM